MSLIFQQTSNKSNTFPVVKKAAKKTVLHSLKYDKQAKKNR